MLLAKLNARFYCYVIFAKANAIFRQINKCILCYNYEKNRHCKALFCIANQKYCINSYNFALKNASDAQTMQDAKITAMPSLHFAKH